MNKKYLLTTGRILFVILIIILLELIGYFGIYFNSNNSLFPSNLNYYNIKKMLKADANNQNISRYLTQPYLNYIPNPGYKGNYYMEVLRNGYVSEEKKIQQHNIDGYRGNRIPVEKSEKFRILCIGGSTTYGTGVLNPENTFSAQLEKLLNKWHNSGELILSTSGVEVINAGLEAGNSAEELMQYLFKYRYFKPDMVVLHSAGNDAMIDYTDKEFQADYTHSKRLDFNIDPLPSQSKWMMKSNFLSFVIIYFFYSDFNSSDLHFSRPEKQQFAHWFDHELIYSDTSFYYHPFYQNHHKLIQAILSDSASVINLSFALNPEDEFVKTHSDYVERVNEFNNIIENSTAKFNNAHFLNYQYDSIPGEYWFDDCHLNTQGHSIKSKMIARKIKAILK